MNDSLTTYNPKAVQREVLNSLLPENFQKGYAELLTLINANPQKDDVKASRGFEYIPIGILEDKLDHIFGPLNWQTSDFKWERLFNEIVGSITLEVLHPVRNEWIKRTGAAAAQVRLMKLSEAQKAKNIEAKNEGLPEPFPLDAGRKIQNGLEMDFPHLKADCISNAIIGLGKFFGRDLRRKEGEKGYYFDKKLASSQKKTALVSQAMMELAGAESMPEILEIELKYSKSLNSVRSWTTALAETIEAYNSVQEAGAEQ